MGKGPVRTPTHSDGNQNVDRQNRSRTMISVCWINVNAYVIAGKQEQCDVYLVAPLADAWGNYPRNAANGGK